MDVMMLSPFPAGERPPSAKPVVLGYDDDWNDVPDSAAWPTIFEQDMSNLGPVQRGLHASVKPGVTLGNYQEEPHPALPPDPRGLPRGMSDGQPARKPRMWEFTSSGFSTSMKWPTPSIMTASARGPMRAGIRFERVGVDGESRPGNRACTGPAA